VVGKAKDGVIKYVMEGLRSSGDINTSLGNIIIMTAILLGFLTSLKIDFRLINDGDDALIFVKQEDEKLLHGLGEYCESVNFHMTIEPSVNILEKIEFCHSHPVWNGVEYVMVRNFPDSISKDIVSVRHRTHDAEDWLAAVGMCGIHATAGISVLQQFYEALVKGRTTAKSLKKLAGKTGLWYLAKGMNQVSRTITSRSRYSFWLAFGMLPDAQLEAEKTFHPVTVSNEVISREDMSSTDNNDMYELYNCC